MYAIRSARHSDLDALYTISLKTGDRGRDATHMYLDPEMMGHIYSAPYLIFEPERCYVLTREDVVVGFIVGTLDTMQFERTLEVEWWPKLRERYDAPLLTPSLDWSPDQKRCAMIHNPRRTPDYIYDSFPAHVHMNLLPGAQGEGWGRKLLDVWLRNSGNADVHVGVNSRNARAFSFWSSRGFVRLSSVSTTNEQSPIWLGLSRSPN